jgi:hypothetical protein
VLAVADKAHDSPHLTFIVLKSCFLYCFPSSASKHGSSVTIQSGQSRYADAISDEKGSMDV